MNNQSYQQQSVEAFITSVNELYNITASETAGPIPFYALPHELIMQLRSDGTRGALRTLAEAEEVYSTLPENIRTDYGSIKSVVDSPDFEWAHHLAHSLGGSDAAANGSYMPKELNRSMGTERPTEDQLSEAYEAVESQGYDAGSLVVDTIADSAISIMAPAATMAVGAGIKALGGIIRKDPRAVQAAREELPGAIQQGLVTGVTRCLPAQIGGSIAGPVGAVAGFACKDIYTACNSNASDKERRDAMVKTGLVATGAVLLNATPLGWGILAGYGAAKFFGIA